MTDTKLDTFTQAYIEQELITDEQSLKGATHGRASYPIPVYDDGYGPLWILRFSHGEIAGIVRARTWEDAFSICEDEFYPESTWTIDELLKEYGPEWMDADGFQESFGFRPNGANARDTLKHCIYDKDLNGEALDLLSAAMLEELGIELQIEIETAS